MAHQKLFVNNKDESPRIFKNNVLDFFSRVHFSVPLFVYVPIISFFFYRSIAVFEVNVLTVVGLGLAGIVAWTLFEYLMHRFVFHYHPKSELGKRIHFLTHGVHHDYPNDSMRLVMPPGVSLPIAAVFYALFYFTMGQAFGEAFFAGFVLGYLAYDMIHYATHHVKSAKGIFKRIQKSHMKHHYREPDAGYSVSVLFWDYVFGTTYKNAERKKRQQSN
ncbi:MAG: sterol desaturase family protein [Bacteroidota bacterium]